MPAGFHDFDEFWPFYVSQHRNPTCRLLHFSGTSLGLTCLALSPLWPPLALLAPVVGYGFSWVGHFFFEGNRPATFRHPLWSLRGDFRMLRLMLSGGMSPELARSAQLYPSE